MARLGDLVVAIGANTRELDKELGKSMRKIKNFGKSTKQLGKSLTMNVTAPIAALGFTAVKAFQQQAKAIAQVEAGLKSTGGQVGYTSQQLQQMASDLQTKTLFGDEQILQEATSQLLTFTNISGEQFQRTQQAALDLATRLDGDLKGASIQLGKALNDPVANLSALSRSGIQFSEEQKEVIKSMAETGRLAEAQTLILDELNNQYGGSAEAAAKADGGFTQLANSFGDLQEEFGKLLVDVLQPVVEFLRDVVSALQNASPKFKQMAVTVSLVAAAIGPLLMIIPTLAQGFMMARTAMLALNTVMLANPFALVAAAIALVVTGIIAMTGEAKKATTAVDDLKAANEGLTKAQKEQNIVAAISKQKELVAQLKAERDEKQKLVDSGYGGKAIKDAREAGEAYESATAELKNMSNELFMLDAKQPTKTIVEDTEQIADNAERAAEKFTLMGRAIDVAREKQEKLKKAFEGVKERIAPKQDNRGLMMAGGRANVDLGTSMEGIDRTADEALNALDMMQVRVESLAALGDQLGNTFGSAFESMASGAMSAKEAMKQMLRDTINMALNAAQAHAIEAALNSGKFAGPAAPVVIPALIGAMTGLVRGAFGQLTAFADGGIVSGPTAALVGEYAGARNNPEVIAPLDKLQSMMGGAGGNVTVTGRISGRDILLSNERANFERNRSRGF